MNFFDSVYNIIITEAFHIEGSVYAPVMRYYIDTYKKFKESGGKKISPEKYPPKNIPLNVKGSKLEKFDYLNPNVNVVFTNGNDSHFAIDTNTITLSFNNPSREITDVVEHEIMHYFQWLFETYLTDKYKEHPEMIKGEYQMFKKRKPFGGMSPKKIAPIGTDPEGYKKRFIFYGGIELIHTVNRKGQAKSFSLEARDPDDAYKRFKYLVLKKKKKFRIGQHKMGNFVSIKDFANDRITVDKEMPSSRTLHTFRPVEYWPDLISNLRHLQDNWYRRLKVKHGDNKQRFNYEYTSREARDIFFKALYEQKKLFYFGTDIHPNYKKSYFSRMYNIFVNNKIPYDAGEYVDEIKRVEKEVAEKVANAPVARRDPKSEKFMKGLNERFGITDADFDNKTEKIPYYDLMMLSNLDDDNTSYVTDTALPSIRLSVKHNRDEEYIKIKRDSEFVRKLYNNMRKFVDQEKKSKYTFSLEGVEYPYYYNALYFAHSLLREIQGIEFWGSNNRFTKRFIDADSIDLLEYLLDMKLSSDHINFISN